VRKKSDYNVSSNKYFQTVEDKERSALVLAEHVDRVDQVIAAVNSLLQSGMSWEDVEEVVKNEKKAGNPVASLIRTLKLKDHAAVLAFDSVLVEVDLRYLPLLYLFLLVRPRWTSGFNASENK